MANNCSALFVVTDTVESEAMVTAKKSAGPAGNHALLEPEIKREILRCDAGNGCSKTVLASDLLIDHRRNI